MKTIRRRRLEHKTDYKARLGLLKSNMPKLVVRKSNRYITVQLVISDIAQDKVIKTANSKELLAYGWPKENIGSLKNIVASYLTSILLFHKLGKSAPKEAILDSGMYRNVPRSKIYGALKGAIDSGIKIPHDNSILPNDKDFKKNDKMMPIMDKIMKELKHG